MMHNTFTWKSVGKTLFGQQWTPDTAPKAVIILVHGHGEHSGRYAHVARYLNAHGIAVLTYDHFGHGKSEVKRGHVPSYEAVMNSITEMLARAASTFPGLPRFLFGHSMGGNFVTNYALFHQPEVQGVILSAPWLRLAFAPKPVDVWLAKIMVHIYPSFTQSTKLDATAISRDPAEVKRYVDDPLIHDKISPVLFLRTYEAGLRALAHAATFPYPLLLAHGTADRLTSFEASKEFAASIQGDATFVPWEGLFHEMHNEPEQQEVMALYKDWMLARA